jgi:ATP-dependent DNA ligase
VPASIHFAPCLCRDHLEGDTGENVVEAKVDGVRCIVHVGETVQAFTRNGTPLVLSIDTEQAARAIGHEMLDGELVGDTLHVFDLPAFGGSWRIRRAALEHAYARIHGTFGIALVPVIHDPALDAGYPMDTNDAMRAAVKMGYEGIVLKDPEADYAAGSRAWGKVKPEVTEDLRVVDCLPNGSLVVKRAGVRVIVGIGLPRAVRAAAVSMLGRLIEVRFQEVTASGSLRHPVFVRIRDDKDEVN